MAALVIADPEDVMIARAEQGQVHTMPCGEALERGDAVFVNTSGKVVKAQADSGSTYGSQRGICIEKTTLANQTTSFVSAGGYVHLGQATLDGLDAGAAIYLSDTAGQLVTTDAEGTDNVVMGYVYPIWHGNQVDNIFHVA